MEKLGKRQGKPKSNSILRLAFVKCIIGCIFFCMLPHNSNGQEMLSRCVEKTSIGFLDCKKQILDSLFNCCGTADIAIDKAKIYSQYNEKDTAALILKQLISNEDSVELDVIQATEFFNMLETDVWSQFQDFVFDRHRISFKNEEHKIITKKIFNAGITDQLLYDEWFMIEDLNMKEHLFSKSIWSIKEYFNRRNQELLLEILKKVNWISTDDFHPKVAFIAFFILQHADLDLQLQLFPRIEKAYEENAIHPAHYAMLYDRVQLELGNPQKYGTQYEYTSNGDPFVPHLENPEGVNKRRDSMYLMPLHFYLGVSPAYVDSMLLEYK